MFAELIAWIELPTFSFALRLTVVTVPVALVNVRVLALAPLNAVFVVAVALPKSTTTD